ncbi:hypothetical protein AB0305_04340 [Arthrobacter sp. NPDC080086]|uniref:hypothetical protein n=1 Tax=Arthrobacter sp. NPDC080086 TaxID=3155917 RepID=UPI0034500058
MTQTIPVSTTYVVIAGAAHAPRSTASDREEADVTIVGVPNRLRVGGVDEQKPQGVALDANTRVLAQILATQTEMLATLKAIEAKLSSSTW